MCEAEPRQQLLGLGDEFFKALAKQESRPKRPSSPRLDVAAELQAMTQLLHQIGDRLARVEERLAQLHEVQPAPTVTKEYYTTQEAAKILGKRPYTVREWCRLDRVHAQKALSGRGIDEEWRISRDEIERIQNEGLLPMKAPASFRAHARLPR